MESLTFTLAGMVFEYDEDRYDTIGDISAGKLSLGANTTIGI